VRSAKLTSHCFFSHSRVNRIAGLLNGQLIWYIGVAVTGLPPRRTAFSSARHLQRRPTPREISGIEGRNWTRKRPVNLAHGPDFHVNRRDLYMPQICDMRQTALRPLRRKSCCRIFRSNPRSIGQHANRYTTEALKDRLTLTGGCSCAPFCTAFSSAHHLQRRSMSNDMRPLLVRDGNGRETERSIWSAIPTFT
jgi:hypothetical protein